MSKYLNAYRISKQLAFMMLDSLMYILMSYSILFKYFYLLSCVCVDAKTQKPKIYCLIYYNLIATEAPPTTTTQPVPTFPPDQLPYKVTSDYVWSNFASNATEILECATSHEALPFDPECKAWGGTRCLDKKNECLGNGPLGMGSSMILRNTSSGSSKVD